MSENFKEFSQRTGLPQPQSTYIFLAFQGKDVWNRWINGEMSEDERAALAKKLGFSELPNCNSTPIFSSIDFRDDPIKDIDFSGFEFPTKPRVHNAIVPCVDFSAAKFGNQARFTNAVFGDGAEFHGTGFGNGARFLNTTFGSFCSFKCSTFGGGTGFLGATFGAWTQFDGVTFGAIAHFENSAFGPNAFFEGTILGDVFSFRNAVFDDGARFGGATFGDGADFYGSIFRGAVDFSSRSKEELRTTLRTIVPELIAGTDTRLGNWLENHVRRTAPDSFRGISFAFCHFSGVADFTNRKFTGEVNFRGTKFGVPPEFAGVTGAEYVDTSGMEISLSADISFESMILGFWTAYHDRGRGRIAAAINYLLWLPYRLCKLPFHKWTCETELAARLRRLRKIMQEIHAQDIARDLFIEERRAERGYMIKAHPFRGTMQALLLFLYWLFSNCGRSATVPLAWLLGGAVAFQAYLLRSCEGLAACKAQLSGFWDFTLMKLTAASTLPIPNSLTSTFRETLHSLFGEGTAATEAIQLWSLGHTFFSVVMFFLIGLALRNHFKIS